jgi:hypothetical protein
MPLAAALAHEPLRLVLEELPMKPSPHTPDVLVPGDLFCELMEWFDKFRDSPIVHDQGIPERLGICLAAPTPASESEPIDHPLCRFPKCETEAYPGIAHDFETARDLLARSLPLLRGHVHGGGMVQAIEAYLGMETPEPDLVQPSDKSIQPAEWQHLVERAREEGFIAGKLAQSATHAPWPREIQTLIEDFDNPCFGSAIHNDIPRTIGLVVLRMARSDRGASRG